jgi:hypothetical protein
MLIKQSERFLRNISQGAPWGEGGENGSHCCRIPITQTLSPCLLYGIKFLILRKGNKNIDNFRALVKTTFSWEKETEKSLFFWVES